MYAVKMLPEKIYNIRRGTWHNRVLTDDARVLVVENDDTSDANSPKHPVPYPVDLGSIAYR